MFGLPQEITDFREVELDLEDGARLKEVITALKNTIPSLEGTVIRAGEERLMDLYKFNVNGHFYYDDDMELVVTSSDRIALLTPVTGG